MTPTRLAVLALVCPVLLSAHAAPAVAGGLKGGYLDILSTEAVGDFRGQQYDAYRRRDGNQVFVGNQQLGRQTLLAGGIGLRLVLATARGVRFSGEGSVQGGRLLGDSATAGAASGVLRGELLAGLGYQLNLGPLVLHAAGIFGGDYASLKLALPQSWAAAVSLPSGGSGGRLALGEEVTLQRWGMRLGAQVGAHLQVSKFAALYGDVTFDYDGQWRSRLGIAIGEPARR